MEPVSLRNYIPHEPMGRPHGSLKNLAKSLLELSTDSAPVASTPKPKVSLLIKVNFANYSAVVLKAREHLSNSRVSLAIRGDHRFILFSSPPRSEIKIT